VVSGKIGMDVRFVAGTVDVRQNVREEYKNIYE
jgi:hypothetical protein